MRLALIFGGRSGEHEVSVVSASLVCRAALTAGFETHGIGITREGRWVYMGKYEKQPCVGFSFTEVKADMGPPCAILPDPSRRGIWIGHRPMLEQVDVDAVFPVLHGLSGEDGTIQGLLEMSGIPYVGAPPLASTICMDKGTTKAILRSAGIPCVPAISVDRFSWKTRRQETLDRVGAGLDYPVFVKPSGSGSSLGVTKVKAAAQLPPALDKAFLYDVKALIEPSQEGLLEIECSVLGNDEPRASLAGQILPSRDFYDYEAKYLDESTEYAIPAPISDRLMRRVQEVAIEAYKATSCKGMARVDFFCDTVAEEAYVNELNTIPGFAQISLYPRLWEASGLPYPALVETLVTLALERQRAESKAVSRVD